MLRSPIRPGEGRAVLTFYLYFLFTVAAAVVGKTARNTFFLSRYDPGLLPWTFIAIALLTAAIMPLYGRMARRTDPRRLTLTSGSAFAGSLLLFAVVRDPRAYALLYVWVEVGLTILFFQFWVLAGRAFSGRQAKRLFGLIGAGAGIANILFGATVGPAVRQFGTDVLLPATAATVLASMAMVASLSRGQMSAAVDDRPAPRRTARGPRRLLVLLALTGIASTVLFAVADYQFKIIAAETYGEADMARIFGLVYAATGVGALATQLFGTGVVLGRFGVLGGLSVLPTALTVASSLLLWRPTIGPAMLLRGADRAFRFTIDQASRQILWLPLPETVRQRAKPIVDESVRHLAQAATGVAILLVGDRLGVRGLALAALPLLIVWLVANRSLARAYLRQLDAASELYTAIESSAIDLRDRDTRHRVVEALRSDDDLEVLHALELLRGDVPRPLRDDLRRLWTTGSGAVRQGVLEVAARDRRVVPDEEIVELLERPAPASLRRAALDAAAARRLRQVRDRVRARMREGPPEERLAATVAWLEIAADEPEPARETLHRSLQSRSPSRRATALLLMQQHGLGPSDERLRQLLRDPSGRVREAALSVAALRGPEWVDSLIEAVGDPRLTVHACGLLAAHTEAEARRATAVRFDDELARSRQDRLLLAGLVDDPAGELWRDHLRDRLADRVRRLVALAGGLGYRAVQARHADSVLGEHPAARANALEFLDGVLPNGLAATLLPEIEAAGALARGDAPTERVDRAAARELAERTRVDYARSPNRWLRLVALDYRRRSGEPRISGDRAMIAELERTLFLRRQPLFQSLPGEQVNEIARIAREVRFEEGRRIFAEGDAGSSLFVIADGRVAIRRGGVTVATLGRGGAFGELALLDGKPRTAAAIAVEPTELLEIERAEFLQLMASRPPVLRAVLEMLTARLREMTEATHD